MHATLNESRQTRRLFRRKLRKRAMDLPRRIGNRQNAKFGDGREEQGDMSED